MKQVFLTGLRINNQLHIGNYFGALEPLLSVLNRPDDAIQVNLFVPDLHSFTTPVDHSALQQQISDTLALYVAAGLDVSNPRLFLYRQSYITAHSELAVILNSFTGVGEMERMTQFKDKSASLGSHRVSVGLFDYPVLMAADILLYGAEYVPVGDDQRQHIEFTRDIAMRMNNTFEQELFVVPKSVAEQHEFFGNTQGLRIMDLVTPTKKMSKSDTSTKGTIFLTDDPNLAHKKIMSATTDSDGKISNDPTAQPGVHNLLQILALLRGTAKQTLLEQYQGSSQYGSLKRDTADQLANFLDNLQSRLSSVDPDEVLNKLTTSEKAMSIIANKRLLAVQKAVGLR